MIGPMSVHTWVCGLLITHDVCVCMIEIGGKEEIRVRALEHVRNVF